MGLLTWKKPEKKVSTEIWKQTSADSAAPGVYVPNMSKEDAIQWRAKLIGTKKNKPQIEIHKTLGGTQLLLIVSKNGGFSYGNKFVRERNEASKANVHLSANGPLRFTWAELSELKAAIEEARTFLENLK